MKQILISIKPKWCELIAEGKKAIEVRKTAPKETPFKGYIYCTKEKNQKDIIWAGAFGDRGKWNGKVIGEFICDKIDTYNSSWLDGQDLLKNTTCINDAEIMDYIVYLDKNFYLWHIIDIKIYDKPKELSEFGIKCEWDSIWKTTIKSFTRPPQSWQYVEYLGG